jgi:hypothetical protein
VLNGVSRSSYLRSADHTYSAPAELKDRERASAHGCAMGYSYSALSEPVISRQLHGMISPGECKIV